MPIHEISESGVIPGPGARHQLGIGHIANRHGQGMDGWGVLADVQKNSFLAAFDVATGKELWRVARGDAPARGTPAIVAAGGQVVVNAGSTVAATPSKPAV